MFTLFLNFISHLILIFPFFGMRLSHVLSVKLLFNLYDFAQILSPLWSLSWGLYVALLSTFNSWNRLIIFLWLLLSTFLRADISLIAWSSQCLLNAQFLLRWLNLIKVHKECSKLCWWRFVDAIVILCCWLKSFCVDNLNSEVILKGKELELIIAFKKVVGTLEEFSLGNKTWCLHC